MGAWGIHFDENDDAADWLDEFAGAPDWSAVDAALNGVGDESPEAPDCSNALAAAEVVAAGIGRPAPSLDPEIAEWAGQAPEEAEGRRALASDVLSRILDDSELSDLWRESDEFSDWQASVNETLSRL